MPAVSSEAAGPVSAGPGFGLPDGVEVVTDHLRVGDLTVTMQRPGDGDALLDALLEEPDPSEDDLPFWAELWPSGAALSELLAGRDLTGVRTLELGCGLGLVGITAALRGAEVLATDWSEQALAFTTANSAANDAAVRTLRCAWAEPAAIVAGGPWPLVVAADVLYEPRNVPLLLGLLPRLVDGDGEILLADPGRPPSAAFLDGIAKGPWHHEAIGTAVPRVVIHRLRLRRRPGLSARS
jgi:predicted nicotinamide N-methyase